MPSASFTTLGCKVNRHETQAILQSFVSAGWQVVPFESPADVTVINTCSVTSDAEAKSRAVLRRARRASPGGRIVATGCAAQMVSNRGEALPEADLLVENPAKLETLRRVSAAFPELAEAAALAPAAPSPDPLARARATIKIQDGCSVMCSYCSIPFTRPGMVSRPWTEVLDEAQRLAEAGVGEAVLTGVLIGAYGPESGSGGPDFEGLVELLAERSGLRRLRISSIEMHQVTDRIIGLAASGLLCPHFHIPLQSGSSRVLADMNRRYDQADYLARIAEIRRRIPEAEVTTDIMVGFPTESEDDFQETLKVVEACGFLKVHAFRFSPRWGTPADRWGDPVDPGEKKRRAGILAEAANESARVRLERAVGRTLEVLFELRAGRDGLLAGMSREGFPVKVAGSPEWGGQIMPVRVLEAGPDGLGGEAVVAPGRPLPILS
ncbi:MAG: MiaB/RimO family radical SAM methylthiotransferase [Fimbriimonadaceae bacterium]|nr:MiaB/RimO family radical SAM methylthiotransferase [Fimbriimonadaceae bacterium]